MTSDEQTLSKIQSLILKLPAERVAEISEIANTFRAVAATENGLLALGLVGAELAVGAL